MTVDYEFQQTHYGSPHSCCLLLFLLVVTHIGCQATPRTTFSTSPPDRHLFSGDGFAIHSDVPLRPDDPIVKQLAETRLTVTNRLKLQEQRDPIDIYLFSDEVSYRNFLRVRWPALPSRRAYFMQTSKQLAVYSFVSSRVLSDLRHEFTHGILHASCSHVPLWLDEGLAEYFETATDLDNRRSQQHLDELLLAEQEGWSPGMFRLEMIAEFSAFSARDYAEAWAWTHFLLNGSREGQAVLLKYIADLRDATVAPGFLQRLEKAVPTYAGDLWDHLRSIRSDSNAAQ